MRLMITFGLSAVLLGCGSSSSADKPKISSPQADGGLDGALGEITDNADTGVSQDVGALNDSGSVDSGSVDSGSEQDMLTSDIATTDASAADALVVDGAISDALESADSTTTDSSVADVNPADASSSADTLSIDISAIDTLTQPTAVCGDLVCDLSEQSSCPFDCSTTGKQIWSCTQSKCAAQTQACQASGACVQTVGKALQCADGCSTLDQACITKCQQKIGVQPQASTLLICASVNGCVGVSGQVCGDGKCTGTENAITCNQDCKAVCGDGNCQLPETALTCAKDCAAKLPPCGDGSCAANENQTNCPLDCNPTISKVYNCVKSKCPSQTATCLSSSACAQAVTKALQCVSNCSPNNPACLIGCGTAALSNPSASALITCGQPCLLSP